MTARTHDIAAITALALVAITQPAEVLSLSTILAALLANQIGGIVPDIDQPTAPLWRNLPVGRLFGKVFDKLLGGHRFISHSLVGLALFGLAAWAILHFLQPVLGHIDIQIVWWAFMIGVVSHLVMDTITKEGVPWLLPIPIKFGIPPLKHLRVTTGTWEETFVILPALILVDLWLFTHYYDQLLTFIRASLRS